jgi:hypothetical protein
MPSRFVATCSRIANARSSDWMPPRSFAFAGSFDFTGSFGLTDALAFAGSFGFGGSFGVNCACAFTCAFDLALDAAIALARTALDMLSTFAATLGRDERFEIGGTLAAWEERAVEVQGGTENAYVADRV